MSTMIHKSNPFEMFEYGMVFSDRDQLPGVARILKPCFDEIYHNGRVLSKSDVSVLSGLVEGHEPEDVFASLNSEADQGQPSEAQVEELNTWLQSLAEEVSEGDDSFWHPSRLRFPHSYWGNAAIPLDFVTDQDQTGQRRAVTPAVRNLSYRTLSYAFGGLQPIQTPKSGELEYETYLGAFATGNFPISSPDYTDLTTFGRAFHDRVPDDHLLGALFCGPYIKSMLMRAASIQLEKGNAEACIAFDSVTSTLTGSHKSLVRYGNGYVRLGMANKWPSSLNGNWRYLYRNLSELGEKRVTRRDVRIIRQQAFATRLLMINHAGTSAEWLRERHLESTPQELIDEFNLDLEPIAA